MADIREVRAGEILFREGDAAHAMYLVKRGRLTVFKAKGSQNVELAEIATGGMIGEMGFFDQKPRSASIKAVVDSELIELPYSNLKMQYDGFPDWIKALVRTVTENLREANKRLKILEQGQDGSQLSPHQVNKLAAILATVTQRWGTPVGGGADVDTVDVKPGLLRKYTIQVFQEPTSKMQTFLGALEGLGYLKQENLGEGKQRITVFKKSFLDQFSDWLTELLFMDEDKRQMLDVKELKFLQALLHFGRKNLAKNQEDPAAVKINLNEMQNESMKELGYVVTPIELNSLITKGFAAEKIQEKDQLMTSLNMTELERVTPCWHLYHALGL